MDTTKDLDTWRNESLSSWKDHRIVDADWVDLHIWFFMHLYADLANFELVLDGYSFRQQQGGWLLVLKLHQGDTPLVAFLSSATPTSCMRRARKALRDGGLVTSDDRFR